MFFFCYYIPISRLTLMIHRFIKKVWCQNMIEWSHYYSLLMSKVYEEFWNNINWLNICSPWNWNLTWGYEIMVVLHYYCIRPNDKTSNFRKAKLIFKLTIRYDQVFHVFKQKFQFFALPYLLEFCRFYVASQIIFMLKKIKFQTYFTSTFCILVWYYWPEMLYLFSKFYQNRLESDFRI